MEKHYVKYLVVVVVLLFFTLITYGIADDYLEKQVNLSPPESGQDLTSGNLFLNFYANFAPLVSGILISGVLVLMVLIAVGKHGDD